MSETSGPGARLRTGAHRFWRQHCEILLRDVGAGDPSLRAERLLAGLVAEQVRAWLHEQGRQPADVARVLVEAVTGQAPPGVGRSH